MTEEDELFQNVPKDPEWPNDRIEFLRQYVVEHPDSALAWGMLGASPFLAVEERQRSYERALDLEPEELAWLWGIARNTNGRREPQFAREVLRRLPLIPSLFDRVHRELSGDLGGDFLPLLKRRVLLDPTNTSTWIDLAGCLSQRGAETEARDAYSWASQCLWQQWENVSEPDHPMDIKKLIEISERGAELAWGFRRLGDTVASLQAARLGLDAWGTVRWAPRNLERQLVGMLVEHRCYEDVTRYCEVALAIENWYCGSFQPAYVWALVGLGRIDDALHFYRTRLNDRLGAADRWYAARDLTAGLRTAGRVEEANDLLEERMAALETAERYPRDLVPELWCQLADMREALGNFAGARAARERAAEAEEQPKG